MEKFKHLTEVRAICGIITFIAAGIWLITDFNKDITFNFFITFMSVTIGLSGFDEIEKGKKATGWMLIGVGIVFVIVFASRLLKAVF